MHEGKFILFCVTPCFSMWWSHIKQGEIKITVFTQLQLSKAEEIKYCTLHPQVQNVRHLLRQPGQS